jgi:hypothetical protein
MDEIPKAIVLWSTEGDHAGFMLVSHEPGAYEGNCVFMLSPVSKEGIDSEMGIVVSELKVDGEQNFTLNTNDTGIELIVSPESFPELVFKLNANFEGEVFTEFNNKIKSIGSAEPAKNKA